MLAEKDEYTPTPAISHAILTYNRGRESGLADGIVITPSHNPPDAGGFKYNPANGGPADTDVTRWIENRANELLFEQSRRRAAHAVRTQALRSATTHRHDYVNAYVSDLGNVVDMPAIARAKVRMAVDPLGGAGVHYWARIAERYALDLTVVSDVVDPTFSFMTVDWDGKIRMDPSSTYAMQRLIGLKDRFRHCLRLRYRSRPSWHRHAARRTDAAESLSGDIDLLSVPEPPALAARRGGRQDRGQQPDDRPGRRKTRAQGVRSTGRLQMVRRGPGFDGSLGFTAARRVPAPRSCGWMAACGPPTRTVSSRRCWPAEITARMGRDPGAVYQDLTREFGECVFDRTDARATPAQKALLSKLSSSQIKTATLAGEPIQDILTQAPGNAQAIGGLKVIAQNGWFAARPSGTEDLYKVYAESFKGEEHMRRIAAEAEAIVTAAIGTG